MENGGVDIDFTSGFPSMSAHYLSANSGSYAVDEASRNFWGQTASSNKSHLLYSESLLLYAQIHSTYSPRTLQDPKATHIARWRFCHTHFH